jgi:hypothetical protein
VCDRWPNVFFFLKVKKTQTVVKKQLSSKLLLPGRSNNFGVLF